LVKEAANAEDVKMHIKWREGTYEKAGKKILKGGWRIYIFCRTRYILHSSMVQKYI